MHYAILAASKRNRAPQETTANGNSTLCSRSPRSDSFVCAGWPASDFDTLTRLAQFGGAMIAVSFRGARASRHKLLIYPLCAGLHSAACMCVSLSFFLCLRVMDPSFPFPFHHRSKFRAKNRQRTSAARSTFTPK